MQERKNAGMKWKQSQYWIMGAGVLTATACFFDFLYAGQEEKSSAGVVVVQEDTCFTVRRNGQNILSYVHAIKDVPPGVNPLFRRSGFIHPLWSPAGKVLTRIQPPDHYHHYGLWGPWTLTRIEGREVDFWNLNKGQGTVRFAGLKSAFGGEEEGGFCVRQDHVDFTADKSGRVSIEELLEVRARPAQVEGRPAWLIDWNSRQKNILDCPIIVEAYRYGGGLGFRATEQWTQENCTVLTSEGKTRREADGTRARWCDVNGGFEDGQRAGIVFLSHPANYSHPEPMRVWPPDANNGRGDLFFEFCPIRLERLILEPQKEYVFRYRMVVYDGTLRPETAEELWKSYAASIQEN